MDRLYVRRVNLNNFPIFVAGQALSGITLLVPSIFLSFALLAGQTTGISLTGIKPSKKWKILHDQPFSRSKEVTVSARICPFSGCLLLK